MMITIEYLRQFRIGGYAIFDLATSFVGVYLLSPLLSRIFRKFNLEVPRKSWLILTLPLGILVHLMTGNITLMTKNFFDPSGQYRLKILIIGLTIFGLTGVRKIRKK